jgi:hypothetical protein
LAVADEETGINAGAARMKLPRLDDRLGDEGGDARQAVADGRIGGTGLADPVTMAQRPIRVPGLRLPMSEGMDTGPDRVRDKRQQETENQRPRADTGHEKPLGASTQAAE